MFIKQMFLFFLLLSATIGIAQEVKVFGKVTSKEDGDVLPYVTVTQKGTSNAVVTNPKGVYSINLQKTKATLIFSFIGMQQVEVEVNGREEINIELHTESIGVEEVVVTALGISRDKKSLGYSSQAVKSDELLKGNPTNAISSLSGRVAGLQVQGSNFAGSQNILLRGASSFSGENQPLFVVDGVPLSNENFNTEDTQKGSGGYDYGSLIADLNPYDIASVDVLKGSAASALYGSRGQNGVIMIITKSGKRGKDSFSIDLNSGVTFERVQTLPTLQKSYGGGYSDTFQQTTIDGTTYDVVEFQADESWGPKFDSSKTPIHWWGMSDYEQNITSAPQTSPWVASQNDVESFYTTGVSYQNSVNVVSSSENQSLRFGYTNVNMTGVVPNSEQSKNTFSFNGTTSLLDGILDLRSSVTYVNTDTKGRSFRGSGDSPSQMLFQWGQRQLDMERLKQYENADGSQRAWNRSSVTDNTPMHSDNPYWSVYRNYQNDDRSRLYGTIGLRANITDELSADGNVFWDTYTQNAYERVDIGSQESSSYQETTRQGTEANYEGKLNYRKILDDFDITAMLGGNVRTNKTSYLSGITNGGLVMASLWDLNNSVNQAIVSDYDTEKKVKSFFAMASVGWKNLTYVDMTYRIDHDTSLPNGNNSYDYFSASGAFVLSELVKAQGVDLVKLRLNYGETGNGTSPYQVYNTYPSGVPFNGTPVFENGKTLYNSSIRPEKTKEVELGVEAALFNYRVGFDASWYNRKTYDQIVAVENSGSTGYTNQIINAGTIRNRGLELQVYGVPIRTRDLEWEVTVNFAKNNNRVQDLPQGIDKIEVGSADYSGAVITAETGATFQELYGYDFAYDNDGNKIIDSNTGFYEQGEFKSLGSVLPDFTAGMHNKLRYKDFDFGILIDTSQGGVYYSLSYVFGMYSGMQANTATPTGNGNTIREDGLVLPGVNVVRNENGEVVSTSKNETRISGKDYSQSHLHVFNTPSATGFFDASYIKLREVSLGYTLPHITNYIKNIHVSVYGRNLAVWGLDNEGIDPETIVAGNGNIQGIDAGSVPGTENYGFNVRLSF